MHAACVRLCPHNYIAIKFGIYRHQKSAVRCQAAKTPLPPTPFLWHCTHMRLQCPLVCRFFPGFPMAFSFQVFLIQKFGCQTPGFVAAGAPRSQSHVTQNI